MGDGVRKDAAQMKKNPASWRPRQAEQEGVQRLLKLGHPPQIKIRKLKPASKCHNKKNG